MKIVRSKKQMIAFYMLGFLIGILYANFASGQYGTASGIFNEYFLNQYAQSDIVLKDYIWYLLGVRAVPFVIVCILGCTRLKKTTVAGVLAWTGFSSGMLMASAILKLGMKGVILCIVGITPQCVFYIIAYAVLLWHLYTYPQSKWDQGKMVFVLLTLAIGIAMEGYINPALIKIFIKAL